MIRFLSNITQSWAQAPVLAPVAPLRQAHYCFHGRRRKAPDQQKMGGKAKVPLDRRQEISAHMESRTTKAPVACRPYFCWFSAFTRVPHRFEVFTNFLVFCLTRITRIVGLISGNLPPIEGKSVFSEIFLILLLTSPSHCSVS